MYILQRRWLLRTPDPRITRRYASLHTYTHTHVVPNAYARRRSHPPAKRVTCSHGPLAAATASAAGSACRCHGSRSTHPCTRFVGITPPQPSDRHSSVPAAAPCYKRHAFSRAPPTDVWPLRVPQVCAVCTLAAATARAQHTRAASPLPRSSSVASLGTTHPQRPRRWGRRGRSLGRQGQRRKGVCRNPRLAAW